MTRGLVAITLLVVSMGVSASDCPTWQTLVEEESVSSVAIGGPNTRVGILVSFIYLNNEALAKCLAPDANLPKQDGLHLFWVGASGPYSSVFKAKEYYLVQANNQLITTDAPRPVKTVPLSGSPTIEVEHILSFEGKLALEDPFTIFFRRGDATYSTEYWVADRYLP